MVERVVGTVKARRAHISFEYIRWHEDLHYTQGLNSTIDIITPRGAGGVRHKARDTVLAVIAYMSAYEKDITSAVVQQLNAKFAHFKASHPNYTPRGDITILGHSLGSAIVFDLLSGLSPSHTRQDLDFAVNNFIAIGSPVGALTATRRLTSEEVAHRVDAVVAPGTRYFNVFHPCDPVAYRVEPLVFPSLMNADPVCIDAEVVISSPVVTAGQTHRLPPRRRGSRDASASPQLEPSNTQPGATQPESPESLSEMARNSTHEWYDVPPMEAPSTQGGEAPSSTQGGEPLDVVSRLRVSGVSHLRDRIDYELRLGSLDLSNLSESMASLTAHNCYWNNLHFFRFLVFVLQAPGHRESVDWGGQEEEGPPLEDFGPFHAADEDFGDFEGFDTEEEFEEEFPRDSDEGFPLGEPGEEQFWSGSLGFVPSGGPGGLFSSPMMQGATTPVESPSSGGTAKGEFPDEKIGFRRFVKGAASGMATGVAGVAANAGSWFGKSGGKESDPSQGTG